MTGRGPTKSELVDPLLIIIDVYWEVKQQQNKQQKHKYDVTALNFEESV